MWSSEQSVFPIPSLAVRNCLLYSNPVLSSPTLGKATQGSTINLQSRRLRSSLRLFGAGTSTCLARTCVSWGDGRE